MSIKEKISSLKIGDEFTVPYTYNNKVYDWTFIIKDIKELDNDKKRIFLQSKYCTNDKLTLDLFGYKQDQYVRDLDFGFGNNISDMDLVWYWRKGYFSHSPIKNWLDTEFISRFPKEFTDIITTASNIYERDYYKLDKFNLLFIRDGEININKNIKGETNNWLVFCKDIFLCEGICFSTGVGLSTLGFYGKSFEVAPYCHIVI